MVPRVLLEMVQLLGFKRTDTVSATPALVVSLQLAGGAAPGARTGVKVKLLPKLKVEGFACTETAAAASA